MKRKLLLLLVGILLVTGCSKITQITDSITNPTARQQYHREFKDDDPQFIKWRDSYVAALGDSLAVEIPYVESGSFQGTSSAYGYVINLLEGERIEAAVERDSAAHRVFIDLYESTASGYRKLEELQPGQTTLSYPIEKSGTYKIIIQPEMAADTDFTIVLSKNPQYGFPVAGKGNAAIQSFWGYERDGGRRKHEGVDIFAKRGTPVVAVADGFITDTVDRGLGGKQVWQRIGNFSYAIYYAHLDEIKAVAGSRVSKGDTLGFVGNTGNAKGGAPHLHFGIYKNGAVDPLPFIFTTPKPKIGKSRGLTKSFSTQTVGIKGNAANLRQMPTTKSSTIGTVADSETLTLLGEHQDWLHVKTASGKQAFLHKSVAKPI